ncbi:3325_t:CDS:2 [Funneliformis mosseae]|uniref:3325_t:CDS:1 n=1 Tax=Funneliformis mosseae TaxID=27381 RepID=A0A9N8ZT05_FUNMO|nr:3325_t:CDS:2 [Funneliformis mosseae]
MIKEEPVKESYEPTKKQEGGKVPAEDLAVSPHKDAKAPDEASIMERQQRMEKINGKVPTKGNHQGIIIEA